MVASGGHPLPVGEETDRIRGIYDTMAPRYDRVIAIADRVLFDDGRRWACAGATGQVLEVAIGTGRNLSFYPPDAQLTGVDLSPRMLDRARTRAETLTRPVDLQLGDAQHLTFPDASFDTVVATLTVCSIPDDQAAVAEMARVLRPGGRLALLDHVASTSSPVRAVQRLLDPALVRLQGDHLLRDPDIAVRRAGLVIEELTRSRWGIVLRLAARKPS
ncbi:MAG: methyltransferase domain-containing protein [Actinomycetota bacterium]|nr:methyltransferase domain-containing protein [Actinomycetota bacterium]